MRLALSIAAGVYVAKLAEEFTVAGISVYLKNKALKARQSREDRIIESLKGVNTNG